MSALVVGLDRFPSDEVAVSGGLRAIWREDNIGSGVPFCFTPCASLVGRNCFVGATPKIWTERNTRVAWIGAAGDARGFVNGRRTSDPASLFNIGFPALALHGNAEKARTIRASSADLRTAIRQGDGRIAVLLDPD